MEYFYNAMSILKEILLVLTPIIVAYFSYRSNKKSKNEVQQEIEKILQEKNAETSQILQKINAELDSQKQLAVWNNSLPQTDEYMNLAGTERCGNISSLPAFIAETNIFLSSNSYTQEDLLELKSLMERVVLPDDDQSIYPYEISRIIAFKRLKRDVYQLLEQYH